MRISRRKFTAAAVSLLALTPTGCTTLSNQSKESNSLLDRLPWGQKEEEVVPYPNPVKVASAWTADTLVQTNRTPTRGFGGRVFFYDEKSRPVPVEGTLIVHGFDDSASSAKEAVKRYEFTPEQLTRHFSQTDLGASYSIWIPWDAIGGEQKRISLVTSFKTSEGRMVQGIPATMVLPGASAQTEEEKIAAMYSPDYLAHRDATQTGSTRHSGLTTTTIRRRLPQTQSEVISPSITLPGQRRGTQIATTGQTPSVDLNMAGKPRRAPNMPQRASILPASAQFPVQQ
ncbi:MAG: hypothetical protein ACPGLY_15485 [Rubripirellula sp.]